MHTKATSPLRIFGRKSRIHAEPPEINEDSRSRKPPKDEILSLRRKDLHVGEILGQGGFGQVFSVSLKRKKTLQHKKKLALKQLRPDLLDDPPMFQAAAKALVNESHIMTILKGHPNILPIRGISQDSDEPLPTKKGFDSFFLVTDALKETMTSRIKRWNDMIPTQEQWTQRLRYALQAAKALAYCHQHHIVYRDCKMDNLGVINDNNVQLYDFGLARELPLHTPNDPSSGHEDHVFHMTICGTQRWMAPEVVKSGWYNCKADTYSWAMTVVEIITGKKPFPHMTLPVHKVLVLDGGGRPNTEGFPTGLEHILRHSWAECVEKRWAMARVCTALEVYIAGFECSQEVRGVLDTKTPLPLHDEAHAKNLDAVRNQPCAPARPVLAVAA